MVLAAATARHSSDRFLQRNAVFTPSATPTFLAIAWMPATFSELPKHVAKPHHKETTAVGSTKPVSSNAPLAPTCFLALAMVNAIISAVFLDAATVVKHTATTLGYACNTRTNANGATTLTAAADALTSQQLVKINVLAKVTAAGLAGASTLAKNTTTFITALALPTANGFKTRSVAILVLNSTMTNLVANVYTLVVANTAGGSATLPNAAATVLHSQLLNRAKLMKVLLLPTVAAPGIGRT